MKIADYTSDPYTLQFDLAPWCGEQLQGRWISPGEQERDYWGNGADVLRYEPPQNLNVRSLLDGEEIRRERRQWERTWRWWTLMQEYKQTGIWTAERYRITTYGSELIDSTAPMEDEGE